MRRAARAGVVLVSVLALAACAVPHRKDDRVPRKIAASERVVDQVLQRYDEVRGTAAELLDAKPLSTVETGPVLAIDSGSFEVLQRLSKSADDDRAQGEVTDVLAPRFGKYPLWFYVVVRDAAKGVNRVQVFERASSVDPWLLSASPETLVATRLPTVRRSGGAAVTVGAEDARGMRMSVQDAAAAYATVLGDPKAPERKEIAADSFIEQMRAAAQTNAGLKGVSFSQQWSAQDVSYALRTGDGGALAFVTLLRSDTYDVDEGFTVTWPDGSPQQAFLASGINGTGRLNYYHQVLLYLPGGGGKPRALGQYGGVVSAEADGTSAR